MTQKEIGATYPINRHVIHEIKKWDTLTVENVEAYYIETFRFLCNAISYINSTGKKLKEICLITEVNYRSVLERRTVSNMYDLYMSVIIKKIVHSPSDLRTIQKYDNQPNVLSYILLSYVKDENINLKTIKHFDINDDRIIKYVKEFKIKNYRRK